MIGAKELYHEMQDELMSTVESYQNGQLGTLDTLINLRDKRELLEQGLEIIKEWEKENYEEIDMAAKEAGGEYNGYKIEVRQGRKMYDFSKIEDIKIAEANVSELKDYYKKAFEAYQKNILTAKDTGEEIQLPELKYGAGSIVVKRNG